MFYLDLHVIKQLIENHHKFCEVEATRNDMPGVRGKRNPTLSSSEAVSAGGLGCSPDPQSDWEKKTPLAPRVFLVICSN
jgi:hypothetical protein